MTLTFEHAHGEILRQAAHALAARAEGQHDFLSLTVASRSQRGAGGTGDAGSTGSGAAAAGSSNGG